jgi:iron complex outermembrane receptor protein
VLVSYALQQAMDQETQAELPNSPRHMAKLRIGLPGPTHRSLVSIEGQYLSTRQTLTDSKVSAAATANVTMIQPVGPSWEIFGSLRNVFDAQYEDPASSEHRQDAIPQNGRTARIGVRWRLWGR